MSDLRQQFNQITQSLLQIQSVRRKRIVVVNDRADMVEYYRLVLRSYEVESFLSSTQASARIAVDPPHLVITDWAQPEAVQVGFLRAYNRPIPDTSAGRRAAISTAIATMDDGELRALAQAVISEAAGPAA
jgi:DNA-binding NtrC family response regulator